MYVIIFSLLLLLVCQGLGAEPPFSANVLPIFQAHCVGCHSGANPQASLDLTSPDRILKGGRSGPSIVAGESDRSLLVEKIVSKNMPPASPKLTDVEVQTVRNWIDKGAPLELAAAGFAHAPAITERDILPIFQMRCVVCHGKRKQEGGLDLRTIASRLKGGLNPALPWSQVNRTRALS